MIIIYIDIILISILLLLLLFTCGYSLYHYRMHRLQQIGQVFNKSENTLGIGEDDDDEFYPVALVCALHGGILLRPTKVLFSHKKEGGINEQLRTVVAYRNPFTGDYCVRKSREPNGYLNSLELDSPDSGVSDDQYEPLNLVPPCLPPRDTPGLPKHESSQCRDSSFKPSMMPVYDNSVNKTWKWDYTEYQI